MAAVALTRAELADSFRVDIIKLICFIMKSFLVQYMVLNSVGYKTIIDQNLNNRRTI